MVNCIKTLYFRLSQGFGFRICLETYSFDLLGQELLYIRILNSIYMGKHIFMVSFEHFKCKHIFRGSVNLSFGSWIQIQNQDPAPHFCENPGIRIREKWMRVRNSGRSIVTIFSYVNMGMYCRFTYPHSSSLFFRCTTFARQVLFLVYNVNKPGKTTQKSTKRNKKLRQYKARRIFKQLR